MSVTPCELFGFCYQSVRQASEKTNAILHVTC